MERFDKNNIYLSDKLLIEIEKLAINTATVDKASECLKRIYYFDFVERPVEESKLPHNNGDEDSRFL